MLRLSSDATNVPVDCVEEKIKLYDQLGDICAHKDLQFYNAAIKFYKMEVNSFSYISTTMSLYLFIHNSLIYISI